MEGLKKKKSTEFQKNLHQKTNNLLDVAFIMTEKFLNLEQLQDLAYLSKIVMKIKI